MKRSPLYGISRISFLLFLLNLPLLAVISQAEKIDVAKVWAGHPVDFAIRTSGNFQCVAYYDTTRRMIIASRTVTSSNWSYTVLPTTTGWDSHNYIDMVIDDSGYVHVSGNMHNVNLIYYRSKLPYSTQEFTSPTMVGTLENSVTYPVFIKGPGGKLIFQYRDGGSGNGTTIWNQYDLKTKKWSRITSQGLFNGGGDVNAYQTSPVFGPDGYFHIIWMWRDSPVANTNHNLSHIKSSDLSNWQTMSGQNLTLPITQSTSGVAADPIASGHGLINMDFWISFDRQKRAVLSYHRYDQNNVSQIFNTRWENGGWKIYQTSNWTSFKWDLDREGSLTHDIAASPLDTDENGDLVQNYVYRDGVTRRWVLDESSLKPVKDEAYTPPEAMKELYQVESTFPGMQVNRKQDGEYYLRWETLSINQDQARTSYPSSSVLRLYRFTSATQVENEGQHHSNSKFSVEKNGKFVTISLDKGSVSGMIVSMSMYSINGKLVAQRIFSGNKVCALSIAALQKGTYIVKGRVEYGKAQSRILSESVVVY